jgi:hypothetical protein
VASSLWGDPRQTNDADVGIRVGSELAPSFLAAFGEPYLVSGSELAEALASRETYRTVQLLPMDEAFKIDLFVVPEDAYTESEFQRVHRVEILPGVLVPYLAPENIAIQKLRWFRAGNEVSDRQWNDIARLFDVQWARIDEDYLRRWCIHFGVEDLLTRVFAQVRR